MSAAPDSRDLATRIASEYQELPGLQLTLAQAVRLFNTDPRTVEATLNRMVCASFLSHVGAFYLRRDFAGAAAPDGWVFLPS